MSSSTSDRDSISTQQNGQMHHGTFLDFKMKRKKWTCDENTESALKPVPSSANKMQDVKTEQDVTQQGKPFVTSKSGQGQDVTQQGKPFVTSKSDQDDDSGIYSDSSSSLFRGSENSMNSPSGTPGHSTPCSEDGSTAGSTSARFGMLRKSNLEVMQEVAEDCDICSKEREDEFIGEENQNKEYSGDKSRENEDRFSDYDEEKAMVIVESDDDDRSSVDSVKLNSSYVNQRHENSWKDDGYENNRKSPVEMTNGETASSYGRDEAKRQEDVSRVCSTTQQEVSRTDYCSLPNTYTSNTFSTASSYSSRNTYEGRESSSTSLTTQSQLASCTSVSNDEMMRNYVSSLQSHGPKFTLKLQTTEGLQDVVFPVLGSFPHQRGYGVGTAALADQQKNGEHEVIDLSMDSAEDKVSHNEDHHRNSEGTDQHRQQEEQYARDNNLNLSENAPRLSDNPQDTLDNSQTVPPPTTSTTGDNAGNNPYYHPSNTATPLMSWAQFSKAAGINLENMSKDGMNPLIQGFGLSGMSLMRGKLPNVAEGALENGDSAKVSLPNMDPNLTVTDWDYLSQVQEAQKEQIKDSKKKGEASEEDPGMQCEICGDKATGLHYGVISCEGCKGFFKRTVQNRRVYVCIGTGECEVNKLQRNRCQFCRFKKCLKKGMIMAAVREDRMPGGRNSGAVYKLRKMKYRKQNDKLKSGALSQTSCTSDSQDSDYQRESLSHYRHLTVTQANQLLYRQNSGQSDYSTSKSTLSESSSASVSNNDPRSFPSPVKCPVSENLAVSSKYTAVMKSGERPLYSPYPKSKPGKALQGNPPQSYTSPKMASPSQQKSPIIDKAVMEGGRPKLRFACPNPGEATVTNRQDYGVSHDLKGTVSPGLASPRENTNHRATEYLVPKLEKNAPSNGNESSVSMVTNTSTSTGHPVNLGYSFPYHPTFSSQALASYMQTYPVSCLPLAGVSSSPSRHNFEHKTPLPPFDDDLPMAMDMRSHLVGKSIKPHFKSPDHGKSHEQPSKPYDYSTRSHAYSSHIHPMRSPYHHRLSDSSARSHDLQEMSLEQQNVIRSATHYMDTEAGHSSKNSDGRSSVRDIHTVPHPLHMATSSYNNNSSHDHRSLDSQPLLAIPTPRLSGLNQHNTLLQAKTHSEMMSSYYNLLDELSRKGKLLSPSGVENSSYELMKLNQSRMATARQETESYEKSNPSPPSKEREQLGNHQMSHGKEKAEVTKQSTLLYRRWSSQCQETSVTPGEDGKQSPRQPSVSGKGGFEMEPCGPRATSDAPNAVTERRVSTGREQPNRASHEEQNLSVMEQSDQETVSKQRVRNRTDSESRVTSDEDESGNQTNSCREETESAGCRSNASSPASTSDSRSEVLLIQQLMNWEDFKNGLTKQQLRDSDDYQSIADIYSRLGDEIMCEIIRWMQKLPFYGLVSLASHTQALQKHWHHVLLLATSVNQAWGQMEKRAGTSAADSQCLLVNNLQKLHAVLTSRLKRSIQFNELFNQSGKMVEKVTRLVCEFAKLRITKEEYVCLKVFMLLTSDNRVSQKIRNYYEVALKKLLQERFPMEEDRFNTLIHLKRAVEDCGDFLMEEQMIHIPFILN